MYKYIIDPISNNIYSIYSIKAKNLLFKFIKNLNGGSDNKRKKKFKHTKRKTTKVFTRKDFGTKIANAKSKVVGDRHPVPSSAVSSDVSNEKEKLIEGLKRRWGSRNYNRTTQFRFFYNKTGRPMKPEKSIHVHNRAFGLRTHDITRYPNCCRQNTHFFLQELYGDTDLYYGIYKFNKKSIQDIKNIIFDCYVFICNIEPSKNANRTIVFHNSREPLHIWGKIGEYEYLDTIREKHTLLAKNDGISRWGDIEQYLNYMLRKIYSTHRDYHLTIEIFNTKPEQRYSMCFYKTNK